MKSEIIIPALLVQQFENQAPRGKALDIGAGRGNNALFLAQQGFFVTAIEIRNDLVEMIKKRAGENQLDLEIVNQDIKDFPITKNSYSLISSINSLNFFSKNEFYDIVGKIKAGLINDGVCAMSLFTNDDPLFKEIKARAINEDDGSFRNESGKKWYFPRSNELKEIFEKDFKILFYIEAIVDDKGHPNNPRPHKHVVARIVVKNKGLGTRS